ncbi:transferase family-domain-containing protein [Cercophora scortea]|uniref:Transferase family-domain-containing protein n=1 Tax=Cercophora scortea TaxID=314031 RepID=A0AAE0I8R2_9PEZI|nr:transferase family-domain-containing protein [Cercophora scortea]
MAVYQDVIGQLPILKTYNHGSLGFPVPDESAREPLILALQAACDKIAANFPWLAGAVAHEGVSPGNSGLFRPIPWPATATSPNKILHVQYCDDIAPSFKEILDAGAPVSMLDGKLLAPYDGFPARYTESPENPAPVIATQATFIRGGMILTFCSQHNMIDATGMFQIINMFANALNGEDFSPQAIESGNRDRATVIPLLAPGEPAKDLQHLKVAQPLTFPLPSPPSTPGKKPTWAYFRLFRAAVPAIKEKASEREGYDPSVPFLSSNDALSAFYWKCISSIRLRNGRSPETVSKFSRAIDGRRVMGVPQEYLGHMVFHSATRKPLGEVASAPLSTLACALRRDLNNANTAFAVRSYATLIANEPDKARILYGGGKGNPDVDVGASAVPQSDAAVVPYGPLGVPAFGRRPNLAPILGCLYFMPPEGGNMMVSVCLREDDLEGLRKHPDWSRITEFIG